jgi:hypothetical protein
VVYPFSATSSIDSQTNDQLVALLSEQIGLGGQVRVIKPDADIQRANFLTSARKLGAQYYLTGFLTPLGDGASIVEQLVSTQSGIVVFSNSGQLSSLRDAAGQGDAVRVAIIRNVAARGYPSFAPDQSPSGTPAPAARNNGSATAPPEANVGGLFHRKKAGPTPSPSPSPSPAASPSP